MKKTNKQVENPKHVLINAIDEYIKANTHHNAPAAKTSICEDHDDERFILSLKELTEFANKIRVKTLQELVIEPIRDGDLLPINEDTFASIIELSIDACDLTIQYEVNNELLADVLYEQVILSNETIDLDEEEVRDLLMLSEEEEE